MLSVATSVILTKALVELNAADAGGAVQPELAQLALDTLNQILDEWNAERGKLYADAFAPFTITPNLQPHTIGPAGATWVTTQAPVEIFGIQINLGGSPAVYRYAKPRDAAWWQRRTAPGMTSDVPTDFYHDPTWTTAAPYGSVYLWPVPLTAYDVQVHMRIVLGQLTANQVISLPPGYNRALMLSTSKALAPVLRKNWSPLQEQALVKVLRQITRNNTTVPRIQTRDAGMPRDGEHRRPNFWFPDGSVSSR